MNKFLVFGLLLLLSYSCSKESKLIGYWNSQEYLIDGVLMPGDGAVFYDIKADGGYHRVFEFGTWELDKKNDNITFSEQSGFTYEMHILELKSDKLRMEHIMNNGQVWEYLFTKE